MRGPFKTAAWAPEGVTQFRNSAVAYNEGACNSRSGDIIYRQSRAPIVTGGPNKAAPLNRQPRVRASVHRAARVAPSTQARAARQMSPPPWRASRIPARSTAGFVCLNRRAARIKKHPQSARSLLLLRRPFFFAPPQEEEQPLEIVPSSPMPPPRWQRARYGTGIAAMMTSSRNFGHAGIRASTDGTAADTKTTARELQH